ncbi:kinase-like protein [Auricularia subglabra TFB-10046 SS5]|nr:kinase-like protein [Auricularia subglabra TFB-10046 SS5]
MVDIGVQRRFVAKAFSDDASFAVRIFPEAIHRGFLSSVYKGKTDTGVSVALKVVQRTENNRTACELFQREIRAVRCARHQNILPFMGQVELDGLLVLISPWLSNGNLLHYLIYHPSAHKQLLLLQVADAVAYLHACAGLVHGDLKCENVLVSDDGKALLADFGLSTFIEKLATEDTTGTDIRVWHTVRFAAPELLFGNPRSNSGRVRSKTPETDVYAFGMLMLQAFSGRKPWSTYSGLPLLLQLARRITHPRPKCPGPFGLTDLWWDVCLACWEFDPSLRPSMEHVRDALAVSAFRAYPSMTSPG